MTRNLPDAIVDDDESICKALLRLLRSNGYRAESVHQEVEQTYHQREAVGTVPPVTSTFIATPGST
jgi:FixJ family two-component response regulator